jgi:Holliday junction resolvase RusA-like endonuclease
MTKHFSFVAENVTPLSQNNRPSAFLTRLGTDLINAHNVKYKKKMPFNPCIKGSLQAKVFYIHRVPDYKDADNISKPLWDSLNKKAYDDDKQIKYLETLKIDVNTPDIVELDITSIAFDDFHKLFDFVFDIGISKDRMLYVDISDYESNKVRF